MEKKSKLPLLIAVVGVLACAGLLAGGIWIAMHPKQANQPPGNTAEAGMEVLWHTPEFSFPDQDGKQTSDKDFAGHVWIADFFFTQCTTACPLLTAKLVLLQRRIADPNVRFVSFSVDPEHDTVEALAAYKKQWNHDEPRWTLLRTRKDTLAKLVKQMHVLAQPDTDPNNPILHSSTFFLIDAKGDVRGAYASNDEEDLHRLVQDTQKLAASSAGTRPVVADDARGAEIYHQLGCASCHDRPKVAPYLGGLPGGMVMYNKGKMTTADDAYLRESIENPSAKLVDNYLELMPAYRGFLNDHQLKRLVAYIHTLPKKEDANKNARIEKDPICGMKVRVTDDTPSSTYKGKTYYFCSQHCKEEFDADPDTYAD